MRPLEAFFVNISVGAGMRKFMTLYSEEDVRCEPIVKIYHRADRINITYLFPGFTISKDKRKVVTTLSKVWKRFREAKISGSGFLSAPGINEPLLPSFGRFVKIPPYYNGIKEIEPRKSNCMEYKIELLTPVQQDASDRDRGQEFDEEEYKNRGKFYPENEKCVECSGPYFLHGYKVILIHVRPLQYNSEEEVLRGYGKIKVYVKLTRKEMEDEEENLNELALTDLTNDLKGFSNLILNPGMVFSDEVSDTGLPAVLMDGASSIQPCLETVENRFEKTEFLIIQGDELNEPAQKLKNWKMKRGLRTDCVPVKAIVNPKEKDADKIKKVKDFIRSLRRKSCSPLRYVLLFGDVDEIPLMKVPSKTEGNIVTEHYYYTHRDPDPKDDSDCILPWIAGGRIPVKKGTHGMSIVNQIISYEKNPPTDPGYYKRMTVTGFFSDYKGADERNPGLRMPDGRAEENFIKTLEDIRIHMKSMGFKVNRVYTADEPPVLLYRDGTPVPKDVRDVMAFDRNDPGIVTGKIIEYINQGQLIVVNRDHGLTDRWEHPQFRISDMENINNRKLPCIIFCINCLTGDFSNPEEDSLAEKFLEENVSPSLIAPTGFTKRWHNDSMVKALFDAIWPGIIPVFPKDNGAYPLRFCRIADILNYAKAYLLVNLGSHTHTKEHFELYHVIGDPTLEIWRKEPSSIKLNAAMSRNKLYIKMSQCPKDAVITIWSGKECLCRKRPTSLGEPIEMKDIPEKSPSLICFWAPGYLFKEHKMCFKQNVS